MSRAVTSELLGIELRTLGISPAAAMVWVVRCQGQSATVELLAQPKKESVDKPLESIEAQTSMQIDLSRTDEAAWPRLIALAASELAEQGLARATATRSGPAGALAAEGSRARSLHVSVFAFDVKTKRKSHTVALGVGLTRLGDPGAWLLGPTLGAELPIGRRTILGSDLRVQWGQSTLAEGTVSWRLASAAVLGGFALTLRPIEASVHVGIRAGQLALSGEAKSAEQSGQRLVGPTGGPLVGLRLRTVSVRGLFAGADLEVGYAWWSVQGNDDAGPPAVTVDGAWTHAAAGVGWELEHPEARSSNTPTRKQLTQANNVAFMAQLSNVAHTNGLAIAQKNSSELLGSVSAMGTDFAVVEECNRYDECDTYESAYGNLVFIIEYRAQDFQKGCSAYPELSIVLRDLNVSTPSSSSYVCTKVASLSDGGIRSSKPALMLALAFAAQAHPVGQTVKSATSPTCCESSPRL